MRKSFLVALLISATISVGYAQSFPEFLEGSWKVENSETYEHWDKINENNFKGISYKMINRKMVITEYLDIKKTDGKIVYTATVLNQNNGIGIDFKLTSSDGLFSFENPVHDFPKFIRYKHISEYKMSATVGTNENNFTLNFEKLK
jgi:carbonic anhydrase